MCVQREEKSERSRRAVLDKAVALFARHGYRATTIREIADAAHVSIGNVYHHFPDKEAIFRELILEYVEITKTQTFPYTRVLYGRVNFPDNIEVLGYAARESIQQYRDYQKLIYVDVIEFGGTHVQQFYAGLAKRYAEFFETHSDIEAIRARLRDNVSPTDALLLTTRLFFNYFQLEILFGVEAPLGKPFAEVIQQIADVVRNGICRERG